MILASENDLVVKMLISVFVSVMLRECDSIVRMEFNVENVSIRLYFAVVKRIYLYLNEQM